MASLSEKLRGHAEGRSSALPASPLPAVRDTLTELPLEQITADPNQPRRALGDLTDLIASIRAVGVIQPIIVRPVAYNAYEIIAGERRYTAAKAAELARVPAIVRTVEEHHKLEIQIVENLHRKDLSPLEEAHGYQRLMAEFGLTQEVLGQRVGKSQGSISETLRLLTLPTAILTEYNEQEESALRVSKSVLLEIVRQPTEGRQLALWEAAKSGNLTVKTARAQKLGRKNPGVGAGSLAGTTMAFRYPIMTAEATVTVQFERPKATQEEIVQALEEALRGEKARLVSGPTD